MSSGLARQGLRASSERITATARSESMVPIMCSACDPPSVGCLDATNVRRDDLRYGAFLSIADWSLFNNPASAPALTKTRTLRPARFSAPFSMMLRRGEAGRSSRASRASARGGRPSDVNNSEHTCAPQKLLRLFRPHNQPLNVVLLGHRHEFVNDTADQMVAHARRQRVVICPRHHHVVQRCVAGARRVDAKH